MRAVLTRMFDGPSSCARYFVAASSPALRRRIRGFARERPEARERVDHHDRAAALCLHLRRDGERELHRPFDVRAKRLLPGVVADVPDRREVAMEESGVHEAVDAAELRRRALGEPFALGIIGDIGRHLEDLAARAERLDALFGVVQLLRRACRDHHSLRAFACGLDGELDAEPGTDPGDDDDLVLEQHAIPLGGQYWCELETVRATRSQDVTGHTSGSSLTQPTMPP